MKRSAQISSCGLYRYTLDRWWDTTLPCTVFVMLNPSTADAETDDATIRKCMAFARRWGAGGLSVYNLFAYRATDPKKMRAAADPIGPANDSWLQTLAAYRRHGLLGRVIAAWGAHGAFRDRGPQVAAMFAGGLEALAINKDGSPKHPLYVALDTVPVAYSRSEPA